MTREYQDPAGGEPFRVARTAGSGRRDDPGTWEGGEVPGDDVDWTVVMPGHRLTDGDAAAPAPAGRDAAGQASLWPRG